MGSVTLLPSAAVDRICHDEQMIIWSSDVLDALAAGGFLRSDLTYDEVVDLHHVVGRELRRIIWKALDHPEARTVYTLPAARQQEGQSDV